MATTPQDLMIVIKQQELKLVHLKRILKEETEKDSFSKFFVNREVGIARERLHVLVDNYNKKIVAKKKDAEYVKNWHLKQEESLRRSMLRDIEYRYMQDLPQPPRPPERYRD